MCQLDRTRYIYSWPGVQTARTATSDLGNYSRHTMQQFLSLRMLHKQTKRTKSTGMSVEVLRVLRHLHFICIYCYVVSRGDWRVSITLDVINSIWEAKLEYAISDLQNGYENQFS